jgi:hypothetical protein
MHHKHTMESRDICCRKCSTEDASRNRIFIFCSRKSLSLKQQPACLRSFADAARPCLLPFKSNVNANSIPGVNAPKTLYDIIHIAHL